MFCIRACIHCTKMPNGHSTSRSNSSATPSWSLSRVLTISPQCPDLGQGVGHHGGHTGPGQHGAVVFTVADGSGGFPRMPSMSANASRAVPLSTPWAVTSTLSGDPCTASTPGRARKRGELPARSPRCRRTCRTFPLRGRGGSATRAGHAQRDSGHRPAGGPRWKGAGFSGLETAPYPARPDRRTRPKKMLSGPWYS